MPPQDDDDADLEADEALQRQHEEESKRELQEKESKLELLTVDKLVRNPADELAKYPGKATVRLVVLAVILSVGFFGQFALYAYAIQYAEHSVILSDASRSIEIRSEGCIITFQQAGTGRAHTSHTNTWPTQLPRS